MSRRTRSPMKALTALVLLAGVVLGAVILRTDVARSAPPQPVPLVLASEPADGNVQLAFAVDGMCCTSCPESLRDAVATLEGFAAIAVDPAQGRVEIEADEAVDPAALTAALTFGDYVARPLD